MKVSETLFSILGLHASITDHCTISNIVLGSTVHNAIYTYDRFKGDVYNDAGLVLVEFRLPLSPSVDTAVVAVNHGASLLLGF